MNNNTPESCSAPCVKRRRFLTTAGVTTTMLLAEAFPGRALAIDRDTPVEVTTLPREKITALAELTIGESAAFNYPSESTLNECMLVKTGERSGGGIGPDQDIVAFSARCTHMGGSLDGSYQQRHKVAGPCPLHLTTFDLTRHGRVVAGHATESLPQIILELDGDAVYATGVLGLVYGHSQTG